MKLFSWATWVGSWQEENRMHDSPEKHVCIYSDQYMHLCLSKLKDGDGCSKLNLVGLVHLSRMSLKELPARQLKWWVRKYEYLKHVSFLFLLHAVFPSKCLFYSFCVLTSHWMCWVFLIKYFRCEFLTYFHELQTKCIQTIISLPLI